MSTAVPTSDTIRDIIARVASLEPATITDNTSLRRDLGVDSLTMLEIGVSIDYEFRLGLSDLDERLRGLDTVADAVALVEGVLAERVA
jgi:acyl carrier protein